MTAHQKAFAPASWHIVISIICRQAVANATRGLVPESYLLTQHTTNGPNKGRGSDCPSLVLRISCTFPVENLQHMAEMIITALVLLFGLDCGLPTVQISCTKLPLGPFGGPNTAKQGLVFNLLGLSPQHRGAPRLPISQRTNFLGESGYRTSGCSYKRWACGMDTHRADLATSWQRRQGMFFHSFATLDSRVVMLVDTTCLHGALPEDPLPDPASNPPRSPSFCLLDMSTTCM